MKPNPIQIFSQHFQDSPYVFYHKDEQNRFTFFDNEDVYLFIPNHLSNLENPDLLPISYIQGYLVYKKENNFSMKDSINGKLSSYTIK